MSLRVLAALIVFVGAASLGACSNSELASNGNIPALPASSAHQMEPLASAITFNPPSPLTLPLNTTVNVTMSETGYTGSYKVVGCFTKRPTHCTPIRYGQACYENDTPNTINSVEAKMYSGTTTMTVSDGEIGVFYPTITCHFKIKDSRGNTATFTATSP
jgi:hypothetical protein